MAVLKGYIKSADYGYAEITEDLILNTIKEVAERYGANVRGGGGRRDAGAMVEFYRWVEDFASVRDAVAFQKELLKEFKSMRGLKDYFVGGLKDKSKRDAVNVMFNTTADPYQASDWVKLD